MKPIQKALKLNKHEYYETHLALVNCILPVKMTPMEIKVLSRFMSLKGDIAIERFGATAKKLIKTQLGITSSGLSNYLRELRLKGFLTEGDVIWPLLFPNENEQEYKFKLTVDGSQGS